MELAYFIFIKSWHHWQMHYPHTRPLHSGYCQVVFSTRENRVGRTLLPVETEVTHGDSKSTKWKGFLLWLVGSLDLSGRYKIFLSCLGCSSQPSPEYYFPHTLFHFINSLSPSNLDRQACWVACLCVSRLNQKCLIISHKFSLFKHKQIFNQILPRLKKTLIEIFLCSSCIF